MKTHDPDKPANLTFYILSLLIYVLLASSAVASESGNPVGPTLPQALPRLDVACDSRLVPVVEEAASKLRKNGGLDIRIIPGTGDALLNRLTIDPKAADILILEDMASLQLALKRKLVGEQGLITLASDKLVISVPSGVDVDPIKSLRQARPERIALPDPLKSPAGLHAKSALNRIGLWSRVSVRARFFASGEAALIEVAQGRADVAIAYATDVVRHPKLKQMLAMPRASYLPITYFGIPTLGSTKQKLAVDFLRFLVSTHLLDAWEKNGFSPPPDNMP